MGMGAIRSSARARAAIAATMAAVATGAAVWGGSDTAPPPQVLLAENALVEPWESVPLRAYLDRVANPPVWTICAGDTKDVKPGMVETVEGCKKRLRTRLTKDFYRPLRKCIPGYDTLPVSWGAMMLSLSWNVGVGTVCRSSAATLGRQGRFYESCLAAIVYNRAGDKMIVGLKRRREMGDAERIGEAELCVTGLEDEG